jgi:hypothetical protein
MFKIKQKVIKTTLLAGVLTLCSNAMAVQLIIVPDNYNRNDAILLNHRLYQQQLEQQKLDAVQETYDITYEGNAIVDNNTRKIMNRALQNLDKQFIERPGRAPSNIDMNNVFYEVGDALNKRFYQTVSVNPTKEYVISFTDGSKLTARHK